MYGGDYQYTKAYKNKQTHSLPLLVAQEKSEHKLTKKLAADYIKEVCKWNTIYINIQVQVNTSCQYKI